MSTINIYGIKYEVIEVLSPHGVGMPARAVATKTGERIAVKEHGVWRFWTYKDRLRRR